MYNILYMNRKVAGVFALLLTAALVMFAAGCVGSASEPAKVNDTVHVFYTLTLEDGTVHESNVGGTPLTFVLGTNQTVKGFDQAVVGMIPGETKTVVVPPELGYVYNNESVYVLPIALLKSYTNETIAPGLKLTMNLFSGSAMLCEVVVVDEESGNAGLFINHPLAGQTLIFEITLASIGEKTT